MPASKLDKTIFLWFFIFLKGGMSPYGLPLMSTFVRVSYTLLIFHHSIVRLFRCRFVIFFCVGKTEPLHYITCTRTFSCVPDQSNFTEILKRKYMHELRRDNHVVRTTKTHGVWCASQTMYGYYCIPLGHFTRRAVVDISDRYEVIIILLFVLDVLLIIVNSYYFWQF